MRRIALALLAAACCASLATACSMKEEAPSTPSSSPSSPTASPSVEPPVTSEPTGGSGGSGTSALGQEVTVHGEGGQPVTLALTGVAYRDASAKDTDAPAKYAVALAFTLRAEDGPTKMEAPISGLSIDWTDGEEQATHSDSTTPWDGCTNAYLFTQPLAPGKEHKAIVDLNTPVKGGSLTLATPSGDFVSWELPDADKGTGYEPATKWATEYC